MENIGLPDWKMAKITMNSEDILNRLKTCAECPYRMDDECGLCGCMIEEKASNPEEFCPDNPSRWGKYTEPKKEATPAVQEVAPRKKVGGCEKCRSRTK